MPEYRKLLASGRLLAVDTALYIVPVGYRLRLHLVQYANTEAATAYLINLSITPTLESARLVSGKDQSLPAASTASFPPDNIEVQLGPLDAINGYASVAHKVDYTIWGQLFQP